MEEIKLNTGIYQIRNIINNKKYIGSAVNIRDRWSSHKSLLINNKHYNKHLQRSFNKYSEENFKFEIIEYIENVKQLIEREQYWMEINKSYIRENGYNLSPNAGSTLGFKYSEEAKKNISNGRKGKNTGENNYWHKNGLRKEMKEKISLARKGKYAGKNHPWYGRKHTEETKQKISEANSGSKNGNYQRIYSEEELKIKSENVKGSKNPMAKLNEEDVKLIKILLARNISQNTIARMFDISQRVINGIKTNKNWKHVDIDKNDNSNLIKIEMPNDVIFILNKLYKNKKEAFIVGGCVRDFLLNKEVKDWDITTNATPDEIIKIFKDQKIFSPGLRYGTVILVINNKNYEITTYRIDDIYNDNRKPSDVKFTSCLIKDLSRRDFTINAMAYNNKIGLIDRYEGLKNLNNKTIKSVNNPDDRFQEDILRSLRAIRFSTQYSFNIEYKTKESIIKNAYLIQMISKERIRDELCKILMSDNPSNGIRLLQENGLLQFIIPELCKCIGFEQHNHNHDKDVFEHIMCVLDNTPPILNVRLSALLHDIAKPMCFTLDENNIGHFYYHHIEGEKLTEEILTRLKFDNKTINDVKILVREHMFSFNEESKIKTSVIKRFINRVGIDNLENLFCLRIADIKGSKNKDQSKIDNVRFLIGECHRIIAEKQPLTVKDLKINGYDLMELGVKQGFMIGKILNGLLEKVLENSELNDRDMLLEIIKSEYMDK